MNILCFDEQNHADRYTVVFIEDLDDETFFFISMNASPFDQQSAVFNSGELYKEWLEEHLPNKVAFEELPEDCRRMVFIEIAQWPETLQ